MTLVVLAVAAQHLRPPMVGEEYLKVTDPVGRTDWEGLRATAVWRASVAYCPRRQRS